MGKRVRPRRSVTERYAVAAGGIALLTAALLLFQTTLAPANLVMLYVPVVAVIALVAGRRASAIASVLAFLAYNFFFVPPLYTLAVEQPQNIIELVILLAVAMLIGTLVARSRAQAEEAAAHAEQMTALYEVSQEISAALSVEKILPRITNLALRLLRADYATIRLVGSDGTVTYETGAGDPLAKGQEVWAPLVSGGDTFGELRVRFAGKQPSLEEEPRPLLQTLATQAALAVERTRLADAALETRMLRESERLKGALLSSVSHDLRTPLAVIKGTASNLLDPSVTWDAATTRGALQTIDAEADRLNRLVRNLLEMSRLEAGALPRSREPVSMSDIVGAVLARLRPLLGQRTISIAVAPDLPDALADPVQIELVLTNVLENAIKYAPPGTPIDIGARVDGCMLRLWIADRGPGFPPGDEQRIFEKFYRASSPDHKPGGSGLGLAIAKGIVEAHGGQIRAENREGGGAVIALSLPLAAPRAAFAAEAPDAVFGAKVVVRR
jgi:two-component system sensor histidine kinase KdpD